jgi:hypothetical protein
MWFPFIRKEDKQYLEVGRLSDVMALIQVLALDPHVYRSEKGLEEELQGLPRSGGTWEQMAKMHPEFFRVRKEAEHRVSLLARHVLPKTEQGTRELPSDFAGQLITAAVDLHDRQVSKTQRAMDVSNPHLGCSYRWNSHNFCRPSPNKVHWPPKSTRYDLPNGRQGQGLRLLACITPSSGLGLTFSAKSISPA